MNSILLCAVESSVTCQLTSLAKWVDSYPQTETSIFFSHLTIFFGIYIRRQCSFFYRQQFAVNMTLRLRDGVADILYLASYEFQWIGGFVCHMNIVMDWYEKFFFIKQGKEWRRRECHWSQKPMHAHFGYGNIDVLFDGVYDSNTVCLFSKW